MHKRWLASSLTCLALGCGGGADDPAPDASIDDRTCEAATGTGELDLDISIEAGVDADVRLARSGTEISDGRVVASTTRSLPAGLYQVSARRVLDTGEIVGSAYQGRVQAPASVCVRPDATTTVHVTYTREPGSQRMWLTQSNGDGAQVMAFDATQLAAAGEQSASVSLSPRLNSVGPIRVGADGRLWVGSTSGKLVAFSAARMGETSTAAPDVELTGSSVCETTLPCGPRALAFDAEGALWVATLSRIVKFAPSSLEASGQPAAQLRITSEDTPTPRGLAFDREGNLWVADAAGAIAKFNAERLTSDVTGAADVVIFAQQPGPVHIGLGEPEGLVFDRDDNLWVGYFSGNNLVRYTQTERATSRPKDAPIIPSVHIRVGVEALVTDLTLDERGDLWLPGGHGSVYRIAKEELSASQPALTRLTSDAIGSVEKLSFHAVSGPLFIAP